MKELGIEDKPNNIFNCDESGISGEQGVKKVFFRKGCRSPKVITGNNEKQHYTIQVINSFFPLFILFESFFFA